MEVIVVLRRVVRAVRSASERRVERDWWSEVESWCGFGWVGELEVLEVCLEKGCKIEDIMAWVETPGLGCVFGGSGAAF
jgi:hypothetical protein